MTGLFVKTSGLCRTPAFLWVVWNFWSLEGTHVTSPQIKTLGAESLTSSPSVCCHNLLLEELGKSHVTSLGEESGSLCLVSPGFHLMYLFPLLIFLCKNLSHEWNCMLSPMSLPRESLNLG